MNQHAMQRRGNAVTSNERLVWRVQRCCLAALFQLFLLAAWTVSASVPFETERATPAQKSWSSDTPTARCASPSPRCRVTVSWLWSNTVSAAGFDNRDR